MTTPTVQQLLNAKGRHLWSVTPDDTVQEHDGVRVAVDSKSKLYLKGVEVDFQDGLTGRGFVFNNPNASNTCGCNNSFSA